MNETEYMTMVSPFLSFVFFKLCNAANVLHMFSPFAPTLFTLKPGNDEVNL